MSSSEARADTGYGESHSMPEIPVLEAQAPGTRPLKGLLGGWPTSGSLGGTSNGSGRLTEDATIPFSIRLTLDRLLELADETELRAHTLAWMSGSLEFIGRSTNKVRSLHHIAVELRSTAERLLGEHWLDPTG